MARITKVVNLLQKAGWKLGIFARRIRKFNVNGTGNVKDIEVASAQVWISTLPNQDEVWGSDDDRDSMNTVQRECKHIKVEGQVDVWLEGCQAEDEDSITLGVDEKELAILYDASVEEEPWPEHLLDVDAPPLWALSDEIPTFAQLEFKRQLALAEAQEMGWEIRLNETVVQDLELVHLTAGGW